MDPAVAMIPTAKDMLSSLLRSKPTGRPSDSHLFESHSQSPSPGPASRRYTEQRHATADFTEGDEDEDEEDDDERNELGIDRPSIRFADQGIFPRNSNPVIPLFSASYLDTLPVYNVVHAIRIIVQTRTETSLSWEQLRSPQVSQFLVKPMQQQIRTQHFSRATLYALMANCLQFSKEGQLHPGNAGVSITRARVCELLALKLLKEYSTRELIDALSYDFDPLQGSVRSPSTPKGKGLETRGRTQFARSSTIEVAILASAKHFVSHPLVVQQLEAIWNGAITFYSSNDNLHRARDGTQSVASANRTGDADARTPLLGRPSHKEQNSQLPVHAIPVRRTVALYDPRNASPLKLSRLRVPRYRYFLSTCSLFVMLCLFLAVLSQRSNSITSLELLFWFWSTGFMLDGVVGFNEQGFSLYIMSYWNIVDLGILLLLIIYYGMRLCGVFLVNSVQWNEMAYEVLAANAILLLPRIFSVLDHYPYFSQLLIAFRFMAEDLMALFVVILISCSGFFVFFTLSKNEENGVDVAYKIFQILMGFTPAAWDVWPKYSLLERALLVFFLVICHFLIATILITVLTNSFTAIASNAKQEHQFLFAINTISMVKNDALFSYIAPANILAWIFIPLRYIMPIKNFVMLNRMVIKLTHWPILFLIFIYEKYYLATSIYEPTDLVESSGLRKSRSLSIVSPVGGVGLFSPNARTRENSIAGFQKDQTLDEVFRRQPDSNLMRNQRRHERRKTQTAIRNWMEQSEEIGENLSRWPTIESRQSHSLRRMSMSHDAPRRFRTLSDVRSAASDPADLVSNNGFPNAGASGPSTQNAAHELKDLTDADGDDELITNEDEDYDDEVTGESRQDDTSHADLEEEDYFTTPMASRRQSMISPPVGSGSQNPTTIMSPGRGGTIRRRGLHGRTYSTNTILYNPQEANQNELNLSSVSDEMMGLRPRPRTSRPITAFEQSAPVGPRSPRQTPQYVSEYQTQSRAIPKPMATRSAFSTIGSRRHQRKPPSSASSDITGLLGDMKNELAAVPASFATQMAMATGQLRGMQRTDSIERERENANRMNKLVLARMKSLEESFADVAREVQLMRSAVPTAQNSADEGNSVTRSRHSNTDTAERSEFTKGAQGQEKGRPSSTQEGETRRETKGKGKEAMRYDDMEAEDGMGRTFTRRGSSL